MNVLYLIYNRPRLQSESFAKIRAARPRRLFIAADGPRRDKADELEKCEEARRVVHKVDWPCEVLTLFREENIGCQAAVGGAITWFFRHVSEGIIIEDDCVASQAFFEFANELLDYYREDSRVWCVNGTNFQGGVWRGDGSYFFSIFHQPWGWATWRRCWLHYDESLSRWGAAKELGVPQNALEIRAFREYWSGIWDGLSSSDCTFNTWDYRWVFSVVLNGGLTAVPNRNLVTNIGFGGDGTHCFGETPDPGIQTWESKIIHPSFVIKDSKADQCTFERIYGGVTPSFSRRVVRLLRGRMMRNVNQLIGILRSTVYGSNAED